MRRTEPGTGFLLVAVGTHGVAVQVVLLRELLSAFGGNELSSGLALAVWIALVSAGALVFGRVAEQAVDDWLRPTVLVAAVVSAAAVPAVLLFRARLGLLPGEVVGLDKMGFVALVVTALPAFLHGALFVLAIASLSRSAGSSGVGRGYVLQGIGTVLGGVAAWLVLAEHLNGLAQVALFGMVLAAAVMLQPGRSRFPAVASVLVGVLMAVVLLSGAGIEHRVWSHAWPGQRVIRVTSSRRGKSALLGREDQRLVLHDGETVLASPPLDPVGDEELALIPVLVHGNCRRVLVVGPGYGLLPALLSLPEPDVVLVQPYPVLERMVREAAGSAVGRALEAERLELVRDDPRRFIAQETGGFDCIISSVGMPQSLGACRLSTVEFYRQCCLRLRPGGVMAIAGVGGVTRPDRLTRRLLQTRFATLERGFRDVRLLATSSSCLFLAGDSLPAPDGAKLGRRLPGSTPGSGMVVDAAHLVALFDPFRQSTFISDVGYPRNPEVRPSTDAEPVELFLAMAREAQVSSPWLVGLFSIPKRRLLVGLAIALVLLSIVTVLGTLRQGERFSRQAAVFGSGFAGAAVPVLAVFIYQVRFGSVYAGIAGLVTTFMLGTVLGGWLGTSIAGSGGRSRCWFLAADLLLAVSAGSLPFLLRASPSSAFFALCGLAGSGVGMQFPICAAGLREAAAGRRISRTAVLDLSGGFLGALLVTVLLVPVLGIRLTAFLVVLVKLIGAGSHALVRSAGPGARIDSNRQAV